MFASIISNHDWFRFDLHQSKFYRRIMIMNISIGYLIEIQAQTKIKKYYSLMLPNLAQNIHDSLINYGKILATPLSKINQNWINCSGIFFYLRGS